MELNTNRFTVVNEAIQAYRLLRTCRHSSSCQLETRFCLSWIPLYTILKIISIIKIIFRKCDYIRVPIMIKTFRLSGRDMSF